MSWYLVKMTPIEPYSFGTDQNFAYDSDEPRTGKETYFVNSNLIPEQTTVYGLIRYLILKDRKLLRPDFRYTKEERKEMRAYTGDSFSFNRKDWESGEIREMSPVFMISGEGHYLVKNPFCNTVKDGFEPMEMGREIAASEGLIHLPVKGCYDPKKGYAGGFFDLEDGVPIEADKIFHRFMLTGNRKNGADENREDSFFKREVVRLEAGYSFAVLVNTVSLPEETVGYMGKKRSAFHVTAQKQASDDLVQRAERGLRTQGKGVWLYALSDLYVHSTAYRDFCIVEEKSIRTLQTGYDETAGRSRGRLKKSERVHMVSAGSVFYGDGNQPELVEGGNAEKIGYNRVIRIGG